MSKTNVPNKTCIPPGKYTCRWTFSPKFMRYTYEVLNVPNRSGIRIHSANTASGKNPDLLGCIALGSGYKDINKDGIPDIIVSRETVKAFDQFMGGKEFTLIII